MAFHLCASGFGRDWDGTYEQIDFDTYEKIPERDYWIYRDSYYWYISKSPYQYNEELRVAVKAFTPGLVDPTGNYTGSGGLPNGVVVLGYCS